ncbi:MAG: hypothetical protein ACQEP0_06120 [Natrinema limicola]
MSNAQKEEQAQNQLHPDKRATLACIYIPGVGDARASQFERALRCARDRCGINWVDDAPVRKVLANIDKYGRPRSMISPSGREDITVVAGEEYRGTIVEGMSMTGAARLIIPRLEVLPREDVEAVNEFATIVAYEDGITLHARADLDGRLAVLTRALCSDDGMTSAEELLIGYPWDGGRPPLGTTSENGTLRPASNFARVQEQLQKVADGEISKATAAHRLDCSPATIDAALDRSAMYGLDS